MGALPDVSTHSRTGGKAVPDMWKSDNNAVQEFEQLKKMQSGQKIINAAKANKLRKQFPVKDTGMLGNTGIQLTQHPSQPNSFILIKK